MTATELPSYADIVTAEPEAVSGNPRRCIATRRSADREALLRFVVAPDGGLVADLHERLPGRGYWVRAERAAIDKAVRGNLFARAAGRNVRVDPALAGSLETALVHRCIDLVGLCRRAGQIVVGFDQVEAALRAGGIAVLVQARDAAPDGVRKLRGLAGTAVRRVAVLDRAELGRALGRDEIVHLGVAPGGLADKLLVAAGRLEGFRQARGDGPAIEDTEGMA